MPKPKYIDTVVVWDIRRLDLAFDALPNEGRDWCDEAGLNHCSAHGLRKAVEAMHLLVPRDRNKQG